MQTTFGFSLPWATALGQSNPVSNRKRWFGEFCFALCSCLCWHKWVFWKLLLEKRQNAAWEWLSTAEGVTLCCWGRNKQWVSQVGKSCLNLVLVNEWWQCLYLTDPSPKQWFLSWCQNKMLVHQRFSFFNVSVTSYQSIWSVHRLFKSRLCFTGIECGGGGGEQRKGRNSVWLLASGFMCGGSCATGEDFIDQMT